MTEPTSRQPPVPNRLSSMPEAVPNQLSTPAGVPPAPRPTDEGIAPGPTSGTESPAETSGVRVSRLRVVVMVGIGLLFVIGFVFRDRMAGNATDIRVGDCFMVPRASPGFSLEPQLIDEVAHSPCKEPHDGEAIFVGNYDADADATFPAGPAIDDFWEAECVPAFEAYTGSALADVQHLAVGLFQPGPESWRHGDREVMCYLTPLDGTTSQSYKDVRP